MSQSKERIRFYSENWRNHHQGNAQGVGGSRSEASRCARGRDLGPIIAELQATGTTSLRAIARGLNERGIPTARGGKWSAVQVQRVLDRQG
jgi:hypothetical protein